MPAPDPATPGTLFRWLRRRRADRDLDRIARRRQPSTNDAVLRVLTALATDVDPPHPIPDTDEETPR